MEALARFLAWLLKKLTFGVLLLVLALAALATWVFLKDRGDFELRRHDALRVLTGQQRKLEAALSDVEARMAGLRVELGAAERRAVEAARVASEIQEQSSGMKRLTTDSEQLRENRARLARMREMEAESRRWAADLQEQLTRTQWERDGLEIAVGRVKGQVAAVEAQKSRAEHYLRAAWEKYGRHVLMLAGIYFLAPPAWRLAAFFLIAPAISRRPPVRLRGGDAALPEVRTSRAALEVVLRPGETMWVKERYLQASDEQLARKTRVLLDWRIPMTCAAAGLVEMIEMRNHGGTDLRATFSSQQDAHTELGLVILPEGASVVVRPRFLAGMIGGPRGARVAIRRHWRIFSLQSWACGQFRYFEFIGPGQLLLAGGRGIRAESLGGKGGGEDGAAGGRRANRDATIGFTTGLAWRPVRAETFWAYLRGMNPLYDDLFEGRGVFLCQETSAPGAHDREGGIGRPLRDSVLRIFGV